MSPCTSVLAIMFVAEVKSGFEQVMIPHEVLIECRVCCRAGEVDLQGVGQIVRVAEDLVLVKVSFQRVSYVPEIKVLGEINLLEDVQESGWRIALDRVAHQYMRLTWSPLPSYQLCWLPPTSIQTPCQNL